jgi:GH25 family lysozyme M1 (1,4-beta-N-acetylmuramidase)
MMAKLIGIDVSEHNGALDWAKIKKAGISFAIIRTGYGTGHTDTYFKRNIEGALAQGIHVGIYHFSYALDASGAKNEAAFVLKMLEP